MNKEIQQIREMLQFCEDKHDIDGTWPHPFLLRSFAVYGNNIEESKKEENCLRINYYKSILRGLLVKQE